MLPWKRLPLAALGLAGLMGLVSMLADLVYEGGRSVQGDLLLKAGSGALGVAIVAAGEALAYASRPLGAILAGRIGLWPTTFLGYALSVGSIPLLALAGDWRAIAAVYLAERLGKGVRAPARDALIAYYSAGGGAAGRAFALHEVLDQVGGVAGPAIVAASAVAGPGARPALAAMAAPAAASLLLLLLAARLYPGPAGAGPRQLAGGGQPGLAVYSVGVGLGVPSWAALSYIASHGLGEGVAAAYTGAMIVDALAAAAAGAAFDRGYRLLPAIAPLAGGAAALASAASSTGSIAAAILMSSSLGVALGLQESVGRAAVARYWGASAGGYALYGAVTGLSAGASGAALVVAYTTLGPGAASLLGLLLGLAGTALAVVGLKGSPGWAKG